MVVSPADRDPAFKQYHLEYRYFKNAQDEKLGAFCKILQYSPRGYLEEDDEVVGHDQYDRELYADGSVSAYTHDNLISRYFARTVDGFSVSPVKHSVTRLAAGNGDLIHWGHDENTFTHIWYLEGQQYLEVITANGLRRQVRLDNSLNDTYTWTPTQETLMTRNEYWTKVPGHPPYASLLDQDLDATGKWHQRKVPNEDDPVKKHIRQLLSPLTLTSKVSQEKVSLEAEEAVQQPLRDQLARDYVGRRADFFKNYGEVLAKSGHTWQSLNIEDVLNSR